MPDARSSAGTATVCVLPGRTVLRMITVCRVDFVLERSADLFAHALDVAEFERAVRLARRPHADQRDVGREDRLAHVGGGAHAAALAHLGHEVADAMLDNRRDPLVDHVDLGLVHVHADHLVSFLGEAGGGDAADVAQTENADA